MSMKYLKKMFLEKWNLKLQLQKLFVPLISHKCNKQKLLTQYFLFMF